MENAQRSPSSPSSSNDTSRPSSPVLIVPSQLSPVLIIPSPLSPILVLPTPRQESNESSRPHLLVEPTASQESNPSSRPRRTIKPVRRLNYIRRPKKVVNHTAAATTTAATATKKTIKQKENEPACKHTDEQVIELFSKFLSYRAEVNNLINAAPSESTIEVIPRFEYKPSV
ncbi:unnamed protein product, partial [Adineta steineri]